MRVATASVTPGATVSRGCRNASQDVVGADAPNAMGVQGRGDPPAE